MPTVFEPARKAPSFAWRSGSIVAQAEVDGEILLLEISAGGKVSVLQSGVDGTSIGRSEVMIKHQEGWNPASNDWEFFLLEILADGSSMGQEAALKW